MIGDQEIGISEGHTIDRGIAIKIIKNKSEGTQEIDMRGAQNPMTEYIGVQNQEIKTPDAH